MKRRILKKIAWHPERYSTARHEWAHAQYFQRYCRLIKWSEIMERTRERTRKILIENGVDPDGPQPMVCQRCRKVVQCDDQGLLWCDCHDERKGIDPNHPDVVPIEIEGRP